jgi:hypothetical protein
MKANRKSKLFADHIPLVTPVNFASRTQNSLSTAIDNICIDSTSPTVNGLPGHDAQLFTVNNTTTKVNSIP